MSLPEQTIEDLAALLDAAALEVRGVVKITDAHPEMTWADAYAVQDALRRRMEARGDRVAGLKMGLTSLAKMAQMGVEDPIRGFVTDGGWVPEGEAIEAARLIHPKVEPEIALVTARPLKGPHVTEHEALEACSHALAALEIIDSRYENFRFDLKSVIADNTSAARFVVSTASVDPREVDLATLGVVLEKNGELVATGAGAAVLGHPAQSLATLANMLGARGEALPAGTLVLTGGITAATAVGPGDVVTARFQGLGSLTARFV